MRETKRIAKKGEKVKVLTDQRDEWDRLLYSKGEVLTVKSVMMKNCRPPGLIFPKEKSARGDALGIFPDAYVVLETL